MRAGFSVFGGTVNLQGGNAVGDQNFLEMGNATVRLLDDETIGGLIGSINSIVDINGHILTIGGLGTSVSTVDNSRITGGGVLRFAGSDLTSRLTGAHTFTGLYQVSAGTLRLGGTGSSDASLLVDGGTFDLLANRTFSAVTLSSGSINGNFALTSASNFDVRSAASGRTSPDRSASTRRPRAPSF